jgi:DNA-binding LacI/PurR family transcriptional regulator
VQRVAAELGYSRDQRAVSLRQQRTSTIGLIISRMSDPYHAELAEELESACRERGFSLISGVTNHDPYLEQHYIDLFLGQRCAGVVIMQAPRLPSAFVRAEVPMVVVNSHGGPDLQVSSVGVLDVQGIQAAVTHLIGLGHRRIGLVAFPELETRTEGYCLALAAAGIAYDPELVIMPGSILAHNAVSDKVRCHLKDHPDITAVAAATDVAALGVLRAAYLLGKRVPADLAVVGFDGISLGAVAAPALTTVVQPIRAMAQVSMDLLLEQIEKGGVAQEIRRVHLETTLVVRESCGARLVGAVT